MRGDRAGGPEGASHGRGSTRAASRPSRCRAIGKGDEMMRPDRILNRIEDLGLLAVVRGESQAAALEVVGALIEGNVLGIEITFTTPEAPRVIRDLNEEYGDSILLGAGTVTTDEQVD